MARTPELQRFYGTKAWQDLRAVKIIETKAHCERCGKDFSDDTSQLIAHHKIELTPTTLSDPNIALNPENVEIVCHKCHSHYHPEKGFIKPQKQVFLVYGPPLGGKTTYVRQNMDAGDLVVDLDAIYSAISFQPSYDHPAPLTINAFGVRDFLYDQIRIRNGGWQTAWVIAGLPRKDQRERLAARLGASQVLVECSKEECHKRLLMCDDGRSMDWGGFIDKWFLEYQA